MAQTGTDVLYVNMQVMSGQLPTLYEMNATAYGMLSKNAKKFRISQTPNSQDFRAPLKLNPPSTFGTWSMAGGSLGTGNSFATQQFVQTYFPLKMPVTVNYDAYVSTGGGSQLSQVNAWKESMKDGLPSFQRMADASWHNQGGANGVVAISTGYSAGTVTCDTEFAANLVQVGQPLEILSADGNTWRTSAVSPDTLPYVSTVNKTAGTFTLTNLGAITPQATDQYIFQGAIAAGSPPTVTWLNGLKYFHTTSTSGSILGLTKTSFDIMPNLVNASGSIVPAHMWQVNAQIRQRRGKVAGKFRGLIHDAQVAAIRNLGLSITETLMPQGGSFKPTDLAGDNIDSIDFGGINHLIDVHQSKTRLDILLPDDNWCRVYGNELDFFKTPEGKMIFEGRASSGAVAGSFTYILCTSENYVCLDPGREAVIYGLTIPNGF